MERLELTKEEQIAIIESEIRQHKASEYALSLRGRVHVKIGNKEGMNAVEEALEKTTQAIDILSAELDALKKG